LRGLAQSFDPARDSDFVRQKLLKKALWLAALSGACPPYFSRCASLLVISTVFSFKADLCVNHFSRLQISTQRKSQL